MTCNFKNSAGTDLDSLFTVDNSNGGALGFKISDGADLGNRFTNKVKLNQTIGFKNSAGTDIGNLRGKFTAPSSFSSFSVSNPGWENHCGTTSCPAGAYTGTCTEYSGESSYSYSCTITPSAHWRAYIGRIQFSVNQPITKAVIDVYMAPKYTNTAKRWIAAVRLGNAYVTPNQTSDWPNFSGCYDCSNIPKVASLTQTYSSAVSSGDLYFGFTGGAYQGENHFVCQVVLTVSNSAGSKSSSKTSVASWFKAYW
jgi:hypothetical protein